MYGLTFRDNCYHCPYACAARTADVTVADFWGYQGTVIPRGKGVSLIMPSTAKGQRLVEMVRPHMLMEERSVAEASTAMVSSSAPQPVRPSVPPLSMVTYVRARPCSPHC